MNKKIDDTFNRLGDYHVNLYNWGVETGISIEDLYQAFKARMLREMAEEEEVEQLTCSGCNGSGEGHYDGTCCYYCKGTGTEPNEQLD